MIEVNFKIKTLLSELDNTNIKYYLNSNDFDRVCNRNNFGVIWSNHKGYFEKPYIIRNIHPDFYSIAFNAYCNILNIAFNDLDFVFFEHFLGVSLIDFLDTRTLSNEKGFEKIIDDLLYLNISLKIISSIEASLYANLTRVEEIKRKKKVEEEKKILETEKKRTLRLDKKLNTDNIIIKKTIENSFESRKKNWIRSISKAKIEEVVVEIIEYGVDNNHDIVALSSRWHSLKDKYNKGVMKEDDFGIENNKIVHALLDFIKNMKNTEGV
jgi:Effector-associated domain 11